MVTPASGVSRWLTLNGHPLEFGPQAENLDAAAQEYNWNFFQLHPGAPEDVHVLVEGREPEMDHFGRWPWRPAGFAGLYDVEVRIGPARYPTRVRVLPNNISQRHYEAMLRQIGRFSADLLFQLHAPASERVGADEDEVERLLSPLRAYALLRQLMVELEAALAAVARTPHRALVGQTQLRRWHEVTTYSAALSPVPGPALAVAVGGGPARPWPAEWLEERQTLSYDVYENRLLKHFLWRQLLPRLEMLALRADKEQERRQHELDLTQRSVAKSAKQREKWQSTIDERTRRVAALAAAAADCRQMQRRVIAWGSLPFLRGVAFDPGHFAPTQILQKHPAYERFYRTLLRFRRDLQRSLNTESFLTTLALRKMSELYQTWATLSLTALMTRLLRDNGYTAVAQHGFFRVEEEFFHFEVDRGADILFRRDGRDGREVRIRYEPEYKPAGAVARGLVVDGHWKLEPDLTLELWEGDEALAVLVFDPKYKTDAIELHGGARPAGRARGPAHVDMEKMGRYYSEIAWKGGGSGGRRLPRIVNSAYVLYPGEELVHTPQQPEVGAIPLVPDEKERRRVATNVVEDLLRAAGVI